jgi:hypothetical protein
MIIEHCTFAYGYGKEAIAAPNAGLNGLIVRYCRFLNSTQRDPNDETSGLTAEIGIFGNDLPIDDVEIYGNWFSSSITGQQRNAIIALGGLGFNSYPSNCKIFNNTFVDIAADGTAYSAITAGGGSGTEARNNLFYNSGSTSVSANTTSNNVTASSNPFVDYSGKDFRITSSNDARNAGTSLGSTYNTDPLGVTRGADGTWDVGAFEYDDGGGSPPSAPSNFRLA